MNHLIFLDESSINLAYTRLYGRAQKNERVNPGVIDIRFERQSILSTIRLDGEYPPLIFEGTLNKELFSCYLEKQLAPTLKKDDILVMDNCSVHTSRLVQEMIQKLELNFFSSKFRFKIGFQKGLSKCKVAGRYHSNSGIIPSYHLAFNFIPSFLGFYIIGVGGEAVKQRIEHSTWTDMRVEVQKVIKELSLDVKPLGIHEWNAIEYRIINHFTGKNHGFTWMWENEILDSFECYAKELEDFNLITDLFMKTIDNDEVLWLFLEDSLRYQTKFWGYPGKLQSLLTLFGELNLCDFYIISKKLAWMVGQNHHDVLFGFGAIAQRMREYVCE